jgi:acyl-coenzyme A thioesterase 13
MRLSVLRGSLSATLVDLVAGLAITSTGAPKTGVSTDLHVSFVGGARKGDTLWIEGIAERVGATLAFTRVRIEKEM